ncbi:hypothetical protein JCM10207_001850 [Rhodosporidiobolus poonsookiae]
MLRFTLLSAVLSAAAVRATILSTSTFPNSACSGAGSSLSGSVGVATVQMDNGEIEIHCGCTSDNFTDFELCPSGNGISVCNAVYNAETAAFTAACGVAPCVNGDCPTTVVNTESIDEDECYNSEKGSIGITVVDGVSQCACFAEAVDDFTACAAPANGRATCRSVDSDFLGAESESSPKIECGVVCDEGFFLTPGGSCVNFAAHEKRAVFGPSGAFPGPGKVGPSKSWVPATKTPIKVGPSPTTRPHGSHTPEKPTTTSRHPHNAHTTSPSTRPSWHTTTGPIKVVPTTKPHGASQHHHHHTSHTRPSWETTTGPIKVGPSPSATYPGPGKVGPSQRARRAAEEFVFTDVCAQDERTCAAGDFGDFTCVRLDDITECGGCNSTGDAKNCLAITGASSVACLRGGCVVRSCQTGYIQTSEGTCELKA